MRWLILIWTAAFSLVHAQFTEVTVQVNSEQLSSSEQRQIQDLEVAVRQFYQGHQWENDVRGLNMVLNVQLAIPSTVIINNVLYFQGQAVFNNRTDQLYVVRDALFPYSMGQGIHFDGLFDPLSSTLVFFAYLLFAGELDTYELMLGSTYYSRAKNIAIAGESDPAVSRVWRERVAIVEELEANQNLRRGKFYFYQAYDQAMVDKPDSILVREAMTAFYNAIKTVVSREGQDRSTTLFLTWYAEEIARFMAFSGMREELADFATMNPESEHIYIRYLESDSGSSP
ncbi:DUF4835 family protein [Candidatus Neomarinimicrobiota bacterium]